MVYKNKMTNMENVFAFSNPDNYKLSQDNKVPDNIEGIYFLGLYDNNKIFYTLYLGTTYNIKNRLQTWYKDLNSQKPVKKAAKIVDYLKNINLSPQNLFFTYIEVAYSLGIEAFLFENYQFPFNTDGQGRSKFIPWDKISWVVKNWVNFKPIIESTGDGLDHASQTMASEINGTPLIKKDIKNKL